MAAPMMGGVTEDLAPRPKRRSFDAAFKARVLAEYEALPAFSADRGALLHAHHATGNRAELAAALAGLAV